MFTGIVQATGRLTQVAEKGGDRGLIFTSDKLDFSDVQLGDSIAVNGVCLTVVAFDSQSFEADVSLETLKVSSLGQLGIGDSVNLEKALQLSDRLGGHLVSGHVDGLGKVRSIKPDGRSRRYQIEVLDSELLKFIAGKGSITVDGTSLTVNYIEGNWFDLNIVPHTWENTIIEGYQVGTLVNLEVDLLARYLDRLLSAPQNEQASSKLDEAFLAKHGFIK